jgi:hypothetical protein
MLTPLPPSGVTFAETVDNNFKLKTLYTAQCPPPYASAVLLLIVEVVIDTEYSLIGKYPLLV